MAILVGLVTVLLLSGNASAATIWSDSFPSLLHLAAFGVGTTTASDVQQAEVTPDAGSGVLVKKVEPVYPPLAHQARVQGTVTFEATISKKGDIESLRAVSGHPLLVPAAIAAVKQWKYKPILIDGKPVEVSTQIQVNFALQGDQTGTAQLSESDLEQKSEKIQALLRAGKFNEAEPLARECIQQLPEEPYFLAQLGIVLNGQGKFREADELRDKIRKVWERDYKAKWIANGSPVGESSWARVVGFSGSPQETGKPLEFAGFRF